MMAREKQQFPWRAVLLFAIAFALIGLTVLFRSHDVASANTPLFPSSADWTLLLRIVLIGALLLLAAFLGSLVGYLRIVFRLRKFKMHDHIAGTRKT
jgi:hypothetical protein